MRLADRIAQCRTPFIVESTKDGSVAQLNSAAIFSKDITRCATRYVLSDELTSLCFAAAQGPVPFGPAPSLGSVDFFSEDWWQSTAISSSDVLNAALAPRFGGRGILEPKDANT